MNIAGGGGGGARNDWGGTQAGTATHGGGNGGRGAAGGDGQANTGAGGGGGSRRNNGVVYKGGDGGSGIVVASYNISDADAVSTINLTGTVALNTGTNSTIDASVNGSTVNVQGVVSGAGNIDINSSCATASGNVVNFSGSNTYTGNTTVTDGELTIGSVLNPLGVNSNVTVNTGATLNLASTTTNPTIGSLAGGGNVTLTGGTTTLRIGSANINTTFSGILQNSGGTFSLTKRGTGVFTLTGNNTYNGNTSISCGTLRVGNGAVNGSLGSGNVTNNANLTFNRSDALTVANIISGAGNLSQNGTGATTLTGANTYSGDTTINCGTLRVGNGTDGSIATTSCITNNANLIFNYSANTTNVSFDNDLGSVISGAGNTTISSNGSVEIDANIVQNGADSVINIAAGVGETAGNGLNKNVTFTSPSTITGGTVNILSGAVVNVTALDANITAANTSLTRNITFNAAAIAGSTADTANYYFRGQPATLSVTNITASKTYDGSNNASGYTNISGAGANFSEFSGVNAFDVSSMVTVDSATFSGANASAANALSVNATLNSTLGAVTYSDGGNNYSVSGLAVNTTSSSASSGTINRRSVNVTLGGTAGKTYDGSTNVTDLSAITNTWETMNATANTGIVTGETLNLNEVSGVYDSARSNNDAADKTVSLTINVTDGSGLASNYDITVLNSSGASVVSDANSTNTVVSNALTGQTITRRVVYVDAVTDSKTYDGTTTSSVTPTARAAGTNTGLLSGDSLSGTSQAHNTSSVGDTTLAASVSGAGISSSTLGSLLSDYNIMLGNSATGSIVEQNGTGTGTGTGTSETVTGGVATQGIIEQLQNMSSFTSLSQEEQQTVTSSAVKAIEQQVKPQPLAVPAGDRAAASSTRGAAGKPMDYQDDGYDESDSSRYYSAEPGSRSKENRGGIRIVGSGISLPPIGALAAPPRAREDGSLDQGDDDGADG